MQYSPFKFNSFVKIMCFGYSFVRLKFVGFGQIGCTPGIGRAYIGCVWWVDNVSLNTNYNTSTFILFFLVCVLRGGCVSRWWTLVCMGDYFPLFSLFYFKNVEFLEYNFFFFAFCFSFTLNITIFFIYINRANWLKF